MTNEKTITAAIRDLTVAAPLKLPSRTPYTAGQSTIRDLTVGGPIEASHS